MLTRQRIGGAVYKNVYTKILNMKNHNMLGKRKIKEHKVKIRKENGLEISSQGSCRVP